MAQFIYDSPVTFAAGTDDADLFRIDLSDFIWLEGFGGNDFYWIEGVDSEDQVVIAEQPGGGIETVFADGYGGSFLSLDGLSLNAGTLEHLTVSSSEGIEAVGNALANRLTVAGDFVTDDTLDGGAGVDTMEGGDGDDTYRIDVSGDVIIEQADDGFDEVHALASYVLPGNVEALWLLSGEGDLPLNINGTGNALDNSINGNEGNNALSGLAGNDTLFGGSGNDTLLGGDGDDSLDGWEGNDSLNGGNGNDTLLGSFDNDRLDGGGGDDDLQGGEGSDTVLGGSGNDTLLGHSQGDDDEAPDVLNGGAGNDEYRVQAGDSVVEAAKGGDDIVYSDVDFVLPANVETLDLYDQASSGTGNAGHNFLRGSVNSDVLTGLAGNDVLDGAEGGDDTLVGGLGNDRYIVRDEGDVVVELPGQGTDSVFAALDFYVLGANVENLTLTDNEGASVFALGNELANAITSASNEADDVLRGLAGNDTLDGGNGGRDSLYGGQGNDTYILRGFDGGRAIELANEGIDTVFSQDSYVLGANLEHLTLLESGESADAIGNDLANRLTGSSQDNFFWGRGGNDTMAGGRGDDEYILEVGDTITEGANAGQDSVFLMSWLGTYNVGANIEDVEVAPMAGAAVVIGNGLHNMIRGNAMPNRLEGGGGNDSLQGRAGDDTLGGGAGNDFLDGGRGADSMIGGKGNDTYVVNSLGDVVNETTGGGGVDTVNSSVSVNALWAGVENLVLAGNAGNATGNNLNNQILGNALRNTIDGSAGNDSIDGGDGADTLIGGLGNDTLDGGAGNDVDSMVGGAGNDTYVFDRADDIADETGGSGIDTILIKFFASPFALGEGIENATLSAGHFVPTLTGNAAANVLTGSELDNDLIGGGGNDTLIGNEGDDTLDGGDGNDSMVGGAGDDTYRVDRFTGDTVLEAADGGHDTVLLDLFVAGSYTLQNNVEDLELVGSEGAAINIRGNALDNVIDAGEGSGNNELRGGAGNDTLLGDTGNDTLLGEAGDDSLDGGAGVDSMAGGLGNDVYAVAEVGDVATELLNQGIDTVNLFGSEGGIVDFDLGNHIENLNITSDGVGITVDANDLANAIAFSPSSGIVLNALGGNDTVDGAGVIANPVAAITLDGGAGTSDVLSLTLGEGGDYTTNLVATGFEVIGLEIAGNAAWNATADRFDISGGGEDVTLSGQSLATSYVFEDYEGGLNLEFADVAAGDDLARIRLLDNADLVIAAPGVEILDVQADASATLDVSGLDGGAEVVVTGTGSVDLTAGPVLGDITLVDYSGQGFFLSASGSGQTQTVNLDNVATAIVVEDSGAFVQLVLDVTASAGPSQVALEGELPSLLLVGSDGDTLELDTTNLFHAEGVTVDAGEFAGSLIYTNAGSSSLTFEAGDSVDWLRFGGESAETLDYGNNLDVNDIIEDDNWGDADSLSAILFDFSGALAISGIESITLNVFEGSPAFIDAAYIEGNFTLNLEGSTEVTIENLQGDLDASGRDGAVNAYLINEGEGNFAVTGGNADDELWVEGFSADTLNGGAGSDTLLGGAGADRFVFDSALGAENVDTILDFQFGTDVMSLDDVFPALTGEGTWFFASAGNGGVAQEADDRIIYDTETGALYYDADGSGAGAAVQFAQLGSPGDGYGIPDIDGNAFTFPT